MTSSINSTTSSTTPLTSSTSTGSLPGSGTMSSPGIGSGLDVNGIVSKLMVIERLPETQLSNQNNIIQAELTAYGTLQGALSSFQTAVQTLDTASTFTASTATVADPTVFTASTNSTAALGSHVIEVQHLAQSQTLQSAAFPNTTNSIGTGSLTFDFGTYSTTGGVTSFAPNTAKQSVTVTIPSGSGTLPAIASAINAAHAGISATVINDGTSYYLQYSSVDGGTANQLRVSASDSDGNNLDAAGLSRLAYNQSSGNSVGSAVYNATPNVSIAAASSNNQFNIALDGAAPVTVTLADGTYGSGNIVAALQAALDTAVGAGKTVASLNSSNQLVVSSTSSGSLSQVTLSSATGNTGLADIIGNTTALSAPRQMTQTLAPVNALLTIDGTTVTESSNIITNAIQGVTLNLLKISAVNTPTTLTIASDNSGLSTKVGSMVTAYNTLQTMLASVLAYNPTTGQAGALQSEGTVRSIQAQLRTAMQTMVGGNINLSGLADIGVAFQQDGSLSFDSTKLQTVLSDPTKNLSDFFIGPNGSGGVADKLNSVLNGIVGSGGSLAARTTNLNQAMTKNTNEIAAMEVRMTAIETRYRLEYTNLDALIASMNTTSTFLTQQLANLPTISGKTN